MGRAVHVGADVLGDCVRAQQRQALELAVERTLPLANAAEAHKLIENRDAVGKIVLTVP